MAITPQQFAERAARQARAGRTEAESRIFTDRAALLIPQARHQFSMEVALDPRRRGRMRDVWSNIALTNGQVEIVGGAGVNNILIAALQWGTFFDGDDSEMKYPLVFKREPQSIFRPLDSNFGYCTVLDNFLLTKKRTSGSLTEMANITIYTSYEFDFSGSYPLPDEFEEAAITTLANLAAADVQVSA